MKTERNHFYRLLITNDITFNLSVPHEGLNGNTPSEACGIKIQGKNKWKTLIENASLRDDQKLSFLETQ